MATTLEIQEKLNKLLEDAEKIAENLSKHYRDHVDLLEKLADSSKKVVEALEAQKNCDMSKCFENTAKAAEEAKKSVTSAMSEAASKTNTATDATGKFDQSVKTATQSVKEMESGISIIEGIGKALSFAGGMASSFLSLAASVGSALFSFAKAVIGFPFAVLQGLIDMSQRGGGSSELAEALREIRKEFGYLNKTAGGAIVQLAKNMKGELANTGLRVYRTFGNLAERLKYFTEYAKNLGETVDAVFSNLKASSAEALGAFNKGLGLTAAGQKGVAQRALATGQDLNEINRQIGNYAIQLSSAFGVTMKLVARDVGEMMADFEHFGNISVQELSQVAVFARKLGIEVKSLGKLVDKFLNFEDAANSAAQLSQAFGMNVDAFKLMSEQDPAKKLEMLRKGFFATGRTIENMTAQERRLLATQTGLGESELALAFSQKSRSVSYADIKKKGDAAQKSQLTQEQVLQKLAGAIERLVKSGEGLKGGFFDVFMQGFTTGIQRTQEFRQLMRALRQSLRIVFYAGIQVGQMFMRLFPGVQDFFVGLRRVFDPGAMTQLMNKVRDAFGEFFQMMTTNPRTAVPVLLEKLKEAFLGRLSAAGPGGRQVLEGIKKFFKAIVVIAASLLQLVIPEITKLFKFITDLITGKAQLNVGVPSDGGFLAEALAPLKNVIMELGPDLWKAFKEMLTALFDEVTAFLSSKLPSITTVLLVAVGTLSAGTLIPMMIKGIFAVISGIISKFAATTAAAAPAAGASKMGASIAEFFKGIGQLTLSDIGKATGVMLGIAVAFTVGGVAMAAGVVLMAKVLAGTPITQVISALAILTAVALNSLILAAALKLVSKVGDPTSLVIGGSILMGAIGVLIFATAAVIAAFRSVPETQMKSVSEAMLVMMKVILAAGLLVGEAMLVGLLVSGPQAAALAPGFLAIGVVLTAMTAAIKKIMEELNALSLNSGFKEKIDAFVNVFKAVSEFVGHLSQILDSLNPGIFASIFRGASLENNLKEMTKFLQGLIGQPGGGGIIGLMETIISSTSRLTPESVRNAGGFIEILKAVGSILTAMQPQISVLAHLNAEEMKGVIGKLTTFLSNARTELDNLLKNVKTFIEGMLGLNLTTTQKDGIIAVTSVISTLATFLQAIMPNPQVIAVLQRPTGSVIQGLDPVKLADYTTFIQNLYGAVKPLLTEMTSFVAGIGRMNFGTVTPESIEMIKGIGVIFTGFSNMVSSLSNTLGAAIKDKNKIDATALIGLVTRSIRGFIDSLKTELPALITGMVNGIRAIPLDNRASAQIEGKVKTLGSLFGVIGKIAEVLNAFSGGQSIHSGQLWDKMLMFSNAIGWIANPGNAVGNAIIVFRNWIRTFEIPRGIDTKVVGLKKIFETIKSIAEAITAITGIPAGAFTTAESTVGGMESFITTEALSTLIQTMSQQTFEASRTGMQRTARAIHDMVNVVNVVTADLARIEPANITTTLTNLGRNLGLGATGTYTIENRNFTVTVNVDVHMDAKELQTALTQRGTTIQHT